MRPPFVHLHTHSHYSLLDGLSKIDGLVKKAAADGMPALALTDHGNLYGAIEFYKTCTKHGVKPIIGVEAYVAPRSRFDKEPGVDTKRYHLTLLAKNTTGYKNLMKLVTASHLEGFYYKPRIDKALLQEHHEGIICLSGCPGGELSQALFAHDLSKARSIIEEHLSIFGNDHYFIEIMGHTELDGYREVMKQLQILAQEYELPLVGTWDAHYLHTDDWEAHETLIAINTGTDVGKNTLSLKKGNYSFITSEEAWEYFKDIPGAYENTSKIADMVSIDLTLGEWTFPLFPLPNGETHDAALRRLAYEGITRRGLTETPEITHRLEYELEIIKNKGFSIYLLIVADLLRHAKESRILTTIRGSVAGSLTTYLVGITTVNPLEYDLPFERFLNPERPSAPDIDMDYADNRRDEMLEYARQKYGKEKVAQIGTFGTMMARGAVRDVARALGYPYGAGDRISKLIPLGSQGMPMTIAHALELVPELQTLYDEDREVKTIIDMAKRIEGCARHISVHAAGVVIAPTALDEFVPVQFDPKGGKIITQYDMHAVEDAGLIKFDFLGIRNLAILGDAIRLVEKIHHEHIDIETIPLDDKKTFAMLARGETMGLFQLNGSGMTRYLKELEPTTIHDINAMVALYRPGPMEMIPEYIKRKKNPRLVSYLDPRLEPILKRSHGVITYQDDVMLIAIHLAGYSWLEADKLRKAMGKKIPAEMEAQKEKLHKGFIEQGLSESVAQELWRLIEPFAAYGFNKAHAASYGRVAYQTAYMKAHYPVEYMTAILTAESGDTEKVADIIRECTKMDIEVLPPSINESFGGFTVIHGSKSTEKKTIRFGLYTIKNVGTDIADLIIQERTEKGPFTSMANFLERLTHKNLNRRNLESLIKVGAFDTLGDRSTFIAHIEKLLEYNKESAKGGGAQVSLFSFAPGVHTTTLSLTPAPPLPLIEQLRLEKELLGLYISGHPLALHEKALQKCTRIEQVHVNGKDKSIVKVCGIIEDIRKVYTKTNNDPMAFIRLTDLSGSIEAVVFPKKYTECVKLLIPDACVAIAGRISIKDNEKSLVIENIKILDEAQ